MAQQFKYVFVSNSGGTLALKNDPIGWDDAKMILKRSRRSEGVILEVNFDYEFIKDGRKYIKNVFDQEGIEGDIAVQIFEFNRNTGRYEALTTQKIALADYKETETGVKVDIESAGFIQKFMNQNDVKVDLFDRRTFDGTLMPVQGEENTSILMHSLKIEQTFAGKSEAFFDDSGLNTIAASFNTGLPASLFVQVSFENTTKDEINENFTIPSGISSIDPLEDLRSHFKFERAGDYSINALKVNFEIDYLEFNAFTPTGLTANTYIQIGNDRQLVESEDLGLPLSGSRININHSWETVPFVFFNVKAGDHCFVFTEIVTDNSDTYWRSRRIETFTNTSELEIEALTSFQSTTVRHKMMFEAFERIAQYMTNQEDVLRSDFYDRTDRGAAQDGHLNAVTDGNALRLRSRKMAISWKELFESEAIKHNLSYGFETDPLTGAMVIRLEDRQYFYQRTEVLNLGEVDFERTVARKKYFNVLQYGFKFQSREKPGTLEEFNTSREYNLPITQVEKTEKKISNFSSAGSEIETQRRLSFNSDEDGDNDEKNFIIKVARDGMGGYIPEKAEDFDLVENLKDDENPYNLKYSPARLIRNWGAEIRSILEFQTDKFLTFVKGEANTDLRTQLTGETEIIDEGADIAVSDLDEPYFRPIEFEIETTLTRDQFLTLKDNPYGVIKFSDRFGNNYQGWLMECKADRANDKAEFVLLELYDYID